MTPAGTDNEVAQIELRLRDFIVTELVDVPYDGADPLADQIVDSLAIEQLVEYVLESYGVELEDEEMVRENFENLESLASLVARKRVSA